MCIHSYVFNNKYTATKFEGRKWPNVTLSFLTHFYRYSEWVEKLNLGAHCTVYLVASRTKLVSGKKWNESGIRPPLCTHRLNWARRTSWGWWDDWDDTVLQTQNSKFEPWRSEAEHATSRSRRLPTILTFTRGWGRNIFVSFKPPRPGTEPRTLAWKAAVLTTTLGPPPSFRVSMRIIGFSIQYLPHRSRRNRTPLDR